MVPPTFLSMWTASTRFTPRAQAHLRSAASPRSKRSGCCAGLRGLNLIGGDVVEVAPPYDQTGNTALVGATMMFEILCVIADRHFGVDRGGPDPSPR